MGHGALGIGHWAWEGVGEWGEIFPPTLPTLPHLPSPQSPAPLGIFTRNLPINENIDKLMSKYLGARIES
ncbi:MAG: hypothetical protein RM338_18010 [Nostoc sp. DedQUE12a]|nr:hypothetical protein [Nostoc sp. DedQUE12a]